MAKLILYNKGQQYMYRRLKLVVDKRKITIKCMCGVGIGARGEQCQFRGHSPHESPHGIWGLGLRTHGVPIPIY